MTNRLSDAVSPYLRSHSENPVDWYPWGEDAFAEATRRAVPLLVSIGYSTCHWCHVMARESFSDPRLADYLNANFVAIKVDREEHPDVDASYLAAAGAFTENLGWPLNVFVTPEGKPFYAGTYWPPVAVGQYPAFRQVLEAMIGAWQNQRDAVEATATSLVEALRAGGPSGQDGSAAGSQELSAVVGQLVDYEDREFGGFGGAPKFPVAPVILFLLERASSGDADALALATRTLDAIAGSGEPPQRTFSALRDRVDGGFFRYATKRDWADPHYERMLYDNVQLLDAHVRGGQLASPNTEIVTGIADFLIDVMEQPDGGFASAQDSESTVDGVRVEGEYYLLDRVGRRAQHPPALDRKVLTGWNGLAIGALATAGFVLSEPRWIDAAKRAADAIVARHLLPDGSLLRASIDGRNSSAKATLEDYGMLAAGLIRLATVTGEVRYASTARDLVDRSIAAGGSGTFGVPGGADPVLTAHGLALDTDLSEGAYPSGLSAMAGACYSLYLLTGYAKYREASARVIESVVPLALPRPIGFGAALAVASALSEPIGQLVIVTDSDDGLVDVARGFFRSGAITAVVTREQAAEFAEAGFELFAGRQREAAYLCHNFVCRLPMTDAAKLAEALAG